MPGGRPNKPTELKKLDGTYRKDRVLTNEMKPDNLDMLPEAPSHFDETAKLIWNKVVVELHNLKLLTSIDLEMLSRYCAAMSMATHAEKMLKKEGTRLTSVNKFGSVYHQKNPYMTVWKDAVAEANKIAGQFGFTPSTRTKIPQPKKEVQNPFEKLKNQA